jgi:signal transduction histidine kinase
MDAEFERFFYTALHDLKAPLRAIDHLSQWVAEDLGPGASPSTAENLKLLRQRAQRMAALLDGLQAYGRAGSDSGAPENVNLGALAEGLRSELPKRPGIELRLPEELPSLRARRGELTQVVRALLDNALRHHDKAQGWVELSAERHGAALRFRVRDNGPGIPLEQQTRIFEPFQTLKPRDEAEGAGLGLSIVERLLKKNGATLRLDSQPGLGSAFEVLWPDAA